MSHRFETKNGFAVVVMETKHLGTFASPALQVGKLCLVARLDKNDPEVIKSGKVVELFDDHIIADDQNVAIAVPLKDESHSIPLSSVEELKIMITKNTGKILPICIRDIEAPVNHSYRMSSSTVEVLQRS
jgi:hypothetical protein